MDSGLTPQILVDAGFDGVRVPVERVKDGQIVLNVHDRAVQLVELNNEWIAFSARFGGTSLNVEVPVAAVLAIYAKENGQGIFFRQDDGEGQTHASKQSSEKKRPHLKLVE